MTFAVEALDERHERGRFDCGEPALNTFLQRYARQNQARGVSRTFVATPEGESVVVGFYSIAAGAVAFSEIPEHLRRRLPRYPIPVVHLGRLATCLSVRGLGLGEALLFDALQRAARVSAELGIAAVEVWAKEERARAFYRRYGFESLTDDPLHLYLPIDTLLTLIRP